MLIENTKNLKKADISKKYTESPRQVLMCDPEFFRVEYAINPYMKTSSGELQKVDVAKARREWEALRDTYQRLGYTVHSLPGVKDLPDMVFTANQSFPFLDNDGKKSVLLSRMHSKFRRNEVPFFKKWYEEHGYKVYELENIKGEYSFEGNGDALIQYPYNLVWGGYGHRTSADIYREMSERFGMPIITLKLLHPNWYHLDTCFSILNDKTVVIQKEAFEEEGLRMIYEVFDKVIEASEDENLNNFCCNCHSPNGKQVITHKGTKKFRADVEKAGFEVIEVDTTEYLKSGGSVFCMKMMAF
jgi:N-dimethylarginine dimethylaminohydrolase